MSIKINNKVSDTIEGVFDIPLACLNQTDLTQDQKENKESNLQIDENYLEIIDFEQKSMICFDFR